MRTPQKNKRPKIDRVALLKAGHLLNMRYKPSELAEEIGIDVDTIYRSWLPAGCPHERDDHGNIWIIGSQFREWARWLADSKRAQARLPEGYAWCFRCDQPTPMEAEAVIPTNLYLELVRGKCVECGALVHRARARRQKHGES